MRIIWCAFTRLFSSSLLSCGHSFLSLSSGFVSGFDLWNRAGAFQAGLQESPHLCLFICCQRKLQMNHDHMFLFYLRPSHGKKMAFQPREELEHGCNSKRPCLSLCISKAVALCLREAVAFSLAENPGDLGFGFRSSISCSLIAWYWVKKKMIILPLWVLQNWNKNLFCYHCTKMWREWMRKCASRNPFFRP